MRSKLLLASTLFAATNAHASSYIIGGQDVGPKDPIQNSTVGLYAPSKTGHGGSLCTASLIKKDIAVTAAHCVSSKGPKPMLIFGRDLHSPGAEHRQVDAVAINPKWESQAGHGMDQGDIALVKFKGGIPDGYKKISALNKDTEIKAGQNAELAGFGISNAQSKSGAGILRKVQVPIIQSRPGKSEMILDQSRGRGACHGDSGGPAFIHKNGKLVLAGITNRAYPNRASDDCKHKVVYTKVPAYKSWIQKSERALESRRAPMRPILMAKNSLGFKGHVVHHHSKSKNKRHK